MVFDVFFDVVYDFVEYECFVNMGRSIICVIGVVDVRCFNYDEIVFFGFFGCGF